MKFNKIGITIGENVKLGKNVRIGDYATIYDNSIIGDNSIISNHAIVGEPTNNYYHDSSYENPTTIIGANANIRSHSVIYAGNEIGENLHTGHHVTLREFNKIGNNCSFGNYTEMHGYADLGNYVRMHSRVGFGKYAKIDDFVFVSPNSGAADDPQPPSNDCIPIYLGAYSFIAILVGILPGVRVGKHCLVGAQSLIAKDIPDYSFAMGIPAKRVIDIRKIKSKHNPEIPYYPWPYSFEKGMPWQGMGFETWAKRNNKEVPERFMAV